jgi:type IV secretion system protein TrbG
MNNITNKYSALAIALLASAPTSALAQSQGQQVVIFDDDAKTTNVQKTPPKRKSKPPTSGEKIEIFNGGAIATPSAPPLVVAQGDGAVIRSDKPNDEKSATPEIPVDRVTLAKDRKAVAPPSAPPLVVAKDDGQADGTGIKNRDKPAVVARAAPPPPSPPPLIDPLVGQDLPLTPKERRALAYGKQWVRNRDKPARGPDGAAVFIFGSTLPTVVCAPIYVCDLVLQEGESVNDFNVGDSVRWKIIPAMQGSGTEAITHVMIKPSDIGLLTNLVITTNRRAYVIKLVSQHDEWMPRVSFEYPDDAMVRWNGHRARSERMHEEAEAAPRESSGRIDFGYQLNGDRPSWRPIRVYTNGAKTYIQFPPDVVHGDLPALVALADDPSFLGLATLFTGPSQQMVNYRLAGDSFEVDKVLTHAALISGVGDGQVSVEITRERRN